MRYAGGLLSKLNALARNRNSLSYGSDVNFRGLNNPYVMTFFLNHSFLKNILHITLYVR